MNLIQLFQIIFSVFIVEQKPLFCLILFLSIFGIVYGSEYVFQKKVFQKKKVWVWV